MTEKINWTRVEDLVKADRARADMMAMASAQPTSRTITELIAEGRDVLSAALNDSRRIRDGLFGPQPEAGMIEKPGAPGSASDSLHRLCADLRGLRDQLEDIIARGGF